jgi:hypothetical protein
MLTPSARHKDMFPAEINHVTFFYLSAAASEMSSVETWALTVPRTGAPPSSEEKINSS